MHAHGLSHVATRDLHVGPYISCAIAELSIQSLSDAPVARHPGNNVVQQ
jgi:hypothetical protein